MSTVPRGERRARQRHAQQVQRLARIIRDVTTDVSPYPIAEAVLAAGYRPKRTTRTDQEGEDR